MLKTDCADFEAEEAWLRYGHLTRTEQAFRDLKSPLAERPIFHRVSRHCVNGYRHSPGTLNRCSERELLPPVQAQRDLLMTASTVGRHAGSLP